MIFLCSAFHAFVLLLGYSCSDVVRSTELATRQHLNAAMRMSLVFATIVARLTWSPVLQFNMALSVCVVALETRDSPVNAADQDTAAEKLETKKPPVHSFFGIFSRLLSVVIKLFWYMVFSGAAGHVLSPLDGADAS